MTTQQSKTSPDAIRTAMIAAASKAGIDLSSVRIIPGILDQTWGDLDGILICGVDMTTAARAAAWAENYLRRHMGERSYNRQVNVDVRGEYTYLRYSNKAEGIYRGHREGHDSDTEWSKCVECLHGIAVSTCYYPCAD